MKQILMHYKNMIINIYRENIVLKISSIIGVLNIKRCKIKKIEKYTIIQNIINLIKY